MMLNNAASVASLVGLCITFVTFCKLRKTSVAVDEAKQSVFDLTDKLLKHDLLAELKVIISNAELIKRKNSTELQAYLCLQIRQSLIRFRDLYPKLQEDRRMLTKCIEGLNKMEKDLLDNSGNTSTINGNLIDQMDMLVSLACRLRNELGVK
ncbi:MAG: hypothetical protein LBV04_01810 [Deferribacteraceae bacterium]|jgi:hypothetical protein|nr:hypothetical protein [Deferribacteraceae bacterium]